jgi:hypothetical protein
MDEFELLFAIIAGIYKIIRFFVRGIFRALGALVGMARRAQGGEVARAREPVRVGRAEPAPAIAEIAKATIARLPAAAPAQLAPQAVKDLEKQLAAIADEADGDVARTENEPHNQPFVPTLRAIAKRARETARTLRSAGASALATQAGQLAIARAAAVELEALLEIVKLLAQQRRQPELLALLAPSDALAAACYQPIVDFCSSRRIPLASDRTATALDGDKLYLLRVDDPSGLALIVLPGAWSTELVWWPAIAHEIGHDFYGSVRGLDGELRRRLRLPASGSCALPRTARLTTADLDAAVGAWQEELFADAFGTMMLGPAYVTSMSTIFARPNRPEEACAAQRSGALFEEHPPGHVRVACACRLLADMGYGADADRLLAAWRARHHQPDRIYLPSSGGNWLALAEEQVVERAYAVQETLYRTGLDALLGVPLRSIPGLDLGPREHEEARRVREALASGRRIPIRDPRLVIAGAALAWVELPDKAAVIFRAAREAALRTRPLPTIPDLDRETRNLDGPLDGELIRDAIILDALLTPRVPTFRRR